MRTAWIVAILTGALSVFAADRILASYGSVKPVLDRLAEKLPSELKNADETKWNAWSRQEDKAIRARLEQGDLDSMVNLLLFGTSFTKQPRIEIQEMVDASRSGVLQSRLRDFLQGLRVPAGNERLMFLRNLLRGRGMDPGSAEGSQRTGVFILENLGRVLEELRGFARRVEESKRPGDPTHEFIERSRLFRDRGVSLDTTIFPNFGIEETLRDLKKRGLLHEGAVKRAAVIGPGLDFVDWDSGYDYYPQQTLQPFALYDSLLRLRLAKSGGIAITAFDISSRVLDHLRRAREQTKNGGSYVLQLPRDPARKWVPEVGRYWRSFGDQIGAEVLAISPPDLLARLEARAVRIRPEVVMALEPVDLDIVLEREIPVRQFDLVVATNILVYYDTLEQTLALQNVAVMLKPGGFLLANSELLDLPEVSMRSLGYSKVRYAEEPSVGDYFIWYQKL